MNEVKTFDTEEDLLTECQRIARSVARGYAVEAEDLSQEAFIRAWKILGRVELTTAYLWRLIENAAIDMHEIEMRCSSVMQYVYTTGVVRKILEVSFLYENWENASLPDSARSAPRGMRPMYDQDLAGDIMQSVPDPTDSRDVCIDIQTCLDRLEPADRKIIIERFKFGVTFQKGSARQKQLYRAIDRLTKELNSYKGAVPVGSPARRAMTNSSAQYLIKNAWEG